MNSPSNDPDKREKYDLNLKLQNLYFNFTDVFDEPNPEKEAQMALEFVEVVARTRLLNGYQLPADQLNWLIDNKIAPILKRHDTTLAGTNEEIFWAAVDKKQAELLAASNREEVNNVVENED